MESYITIDKIKVVDNYINNNDYFIIFGDYNERYSINGSGEVIINKIIDKFVSSLRMKVSVFNVANTTGAYKTAVLIYYTFNGKQYVSQSDLTYNIVLPEVLDNEYLTVTVDRLDYNKPLFDAWVKDNNGRKFKIQTNSIITKFSDYMNVNLGTPGCDTSYPDFK
jgi:hypothetical protein